MSAFYLACIVCAFMLALVLGLAADHHRFSFFLSYHTPPRLSIHPKYEMAKKIRSFRRHLFAQGKSAHHESRDFDVHMALTHARRFARRFCRDGGNFVQRYFRHHKNPMQTCICHGVSASVRLSTEGRFRDAHFFLKRSTLRFPAAAVSLLQILPLSESLAPPRL